MRVTGKLEAEVAIKASADKFHLLFSRRVYELPNITPDKIRGAILLEGNWGCPGSVVEWIYVLEGRTNSSKTILSIDEENKSITYKAMEGDLMNRYKSYKLVIKATPEGDNSVVHWTLEFEKLALVIPSPDDLLHFGVQVIMDVEDYLVRA